MENRRTAGEEFFELCVLTEMSSDMTETSMRGRGCTKIEQSMFGQGVLEDGNGSACSVGQVLKSETVWTGLDAVYS